MIRVLVISVMVFLSDVAKDCLLLLLFLLDVGLFIAVF